jgi:hypothetical protein
MNDIQNFLPKLQQHLLAKVKQTLMDRRTTEENQCSPLPRGPGDWSFVVFKGHRIYMHQTIRIRYTTYDLRREEDLVRIHSAKANIMVVNPEYASRPSNEASPAVPMFCYARILGIYHANIIYVGPGNTDLAPQRVDFLWVRWYRAKESHHSANGTDHLTFPKSCDPGTFGFVDPASICRGSHILPHFAGGKVGDTVNSKTRYIRDST